MADNTNPFVSNDWFEEFHMLTTTPGQGVASTDSSTNGNYDSSSYAPSSDDSSSDDSSSDDSSSDDSSSDDSSSDDSSGYAPSSDDDSSSDDFSISEFSTGNFSIGDLSSSDSSSDYFSSDTETASSVADSEPTNSSLGLLFALDGQVIDTTPLLGDYPFLPALPHEFPNIFLVTDGRSFEGAPSFDMIDELGIIIILPLGFSLPDLNIQPYDITDSPEEDFSSFMAFAPNGRVTQELADAAFVIEVRDPDRFLGSIGDNGRYESARHMLEELYAWLYGSNDSDEDENLP
ncbi:hypothetical protein GGI35DRAFT_492627 [Trichoderma velutinum]